MKEAIIYFLQNGYEVIVEIDSRDSYTDKRKRTKAESQQIAEILLQGYRLLNCFPSYDYRVSDRVQELTAVRKICDFIISSSR